jgi:hypothetical protein
MKQRARFVYLAAYGGGIYRAGLSVSETPSLNQLPRYLGARPVRLVGLWRAPSPRSVVARLSRRLFGRSRVLPGGFYSGGLKWIRRAIAFDVAHQNIDAIEAKILARGIAMPERPGQCATLAILRPTDDAVTHGIEAARRGIHPCAVIASPELLHMCARNGDTLTNPTGATLPPDYLSKTRHEHP